jgi:hypothetical protein
VQFNWFTQNVSRVGLLPATAPPQGLIPGGTATALSYGQSGLLGTAHPCGGPAGGPAVAAYWSAIQAAGATCNGVTNQFFNMQFAVLNSSLTDVDLTGNANSSDQNSETITAVAFGANGPMQSPFLGGVTFYAVDVRQPINTDATLGGTPTGNGVALIPICTASSIFNDLASNSWNYSCTYSPSAGGVASMLQAFDFAGFNLPNSTNQMAGWAAAGGGIIAPWGLLGWGSPTPTAAGVINSGFWGNGQLSGPTGLPTTGFNQGWQGNPTAVAVGLPDNTIIPVIAIGCNAVGNCLATRVNASVSFNVDK